MTKGLECLELIKNDIIKEYGRIPLLEKLHIEVIEKELKALEIIKKKDVDIYILNSCKTVNEYNSKIVHIAGEIRELNEKEFELLKEVLCYERKK